MKTILNNIINNIYDVDEINVLEHNGRILVYIQDNEDKIFNNLNIKLKQHNLYLERMNKKMFCLKSK